MDSLDNVSVPAPPTYVYSSSPQTLDPISTIVVLIWENAIEIHNARSCDDERRIESSKGDAKCTLAELFEAVDAAKEKSRASESRWRAKIDEALDRFQLYAPAVDVLIQQQPNITSIVWGSFRLLLHVATRKSGLATKIEDGMVLILMNIWTWHQIIKNEPSADSIFDICSQLFSHVLTFLVEARIYSEASELVQFWTSGFTRSPEIIDMAVESIRNVSNDLHHAAQAITNSKASQFHNISNKSPQNSVPRGVNISGVGLSCYDLQKEEILRQSQFRNGNRAYNLTDVQIAKTCKEICISYQSTGDSLRESARRSILRHEEEDRHRKVERAIQMLAPQQQIPINIPPRAQDTCEWILDHEVFIQWNRSPCRLPLWIHGFPGCGKTVMASYLRHRFTSLAQPTFAHFFSLNTDKEAAEKNSFSISIILQILKKGIDTTVPGFLRVVEDIANFCLQFDNSNQLSFLALRPRIYDAFKELHEYTLIIDGLDECEQSGEPVMDLINELNAGSLEPRPRIVILSRKSDTLSRLCANAVPIAMDESAVMPDIERFIAEKVREYPILKPMYEDIIEKTEKSCHGHFLWASTMMTCLWAPATHREERLKRLQSIPESLMDFYEDLVNKANKRMTEWEKRLRREILLLLLNPKRALTVDEVATALQFRCKKRQPEKRRLEDIRDTITQLCWPLVSIIEERAILVHTLVEDFLTQTTRNEVEESLSVHITRAESDATLATRSLNVLSERRNRDPSRISYWLYKNVYYEFAIPKSAVKLQEDGLQDIVFYEYAARYWEYHLTSVKDPSADLLDIASSFLHNFEFVMYGEYLYDLKFGEIGPISEVRAGLQSWSRFLPPNLQEHLNLDEFYEDPYKKLAREYGKLEGSKVLKYLCLFRLGDFYTLQALLEVRYETFKEVADGLEAILGSEEPLVLRAKYMFAACFLPRGEFSQALELATKISELQKTICGLEKSDYWKTLQLVATVQFLMTDFEAAAATQTRVTDGWAGVKTVKRFNVQISEMFSGFVFEARGLLSDALQRYELVEQTQRKALGSENVLTLFAQASMSSVYHKQKKYGEAKNLLEHALPGRQVLYGERDQSVVDTTIQFIILDREIGELDAAQARIDILMENGSLDDKYERCCQVRHLQALVLLDQGEFEKARKILHSLLDEQAEKGREANNRSLLWVRLTLATILRDHEKGDEAALLFENIATAIVHGDVSPQFDRLDTPEELRIAEEGLRLVRDRKQQEADKILRKHNLRWVRKADFWLIEGAPSVDTAWMKGP
ncbi:uncharacterized protein PAC_19663 [Phialocephala subalpina]|uniref:Uncharacterized protein n=1 Tax=Phialocephala subalpina TaxID=576137 RepID=A0A1L7XXI0_9HELO|nr:uncharacterized protein PAC_19663 [Phialocephala subalpina]